MSRLLLSSFLLCAACGSSASKPAASSAGSTGQRYEADAGNIGGASGAGGDTRSSTAGGAGGSGGVSGAAGDTRSSSGNGGSSGGDTRSSSGGGAGSTGGVFGAGGDTRSSNAGGAGGARPGDGSTPDGAALADSRGGADVPSDAALLAIASQLQGFRIELPCDTMTSEAGVCTTTATVDKQTHPLTIGGDPGTVYEIELRVRGVVEWMTYSGCAASTQAPFCIGGTKLDATFNIYSLSVPDPKQTYYFNRGTAIEHAVYTIDYTVTIHVHGGAALTFSVDGQNQKEMANITNLVVPGIPPAPQAYAGQFLQLDVVSVAAR